jgi:hypothetical protein
VSNKIALALVLFAAAAGLRIAWLLARRAGEQFMIVNCQSAPFPARLRDKRLARRLIRLGHHVRLASHPELTGRVVARFGLQVVVFARWRPGEVWLLWDFEVERTRTWRQIAGRLSPRLSAWLSRNEPVPFDLTADGAAVLAAPEIPAAGLAS